MKPKGSHPARALNPLKIKAATGPGRYADGNGLYLLVDPSGAKRWLLRTMVQGRRRDIGLGSASLVSLADAREQAATLRRRAREGGDPLAERRKAKRPIPTFEDAAKQVHAAHSKGWKNPKHAAQWLTTLEQYAFPSFGDVPVDQVASADLLKALSPIWLTKPETARRVRQRVGTVLDWAKAAGLRDGENPVQGITRGLPRQTDKPEHHTALPYTEVPAFLGRLRSSDASPATRRAFEFLILTAGRTGEVVQAQWPEFDLEAAVWTIPAERMKAGREHRVPLSPRTLAILAEAKAEATSEWVFPSRTGTRPLSNMALLMLLRRMGEAVTAHGFRSAFRDWAAERTNFARDVCEMALAHTIHDKTEAAYRRGDLLEKRRQLMDTWSSFATGVGGEVVPLRA